MERVTSLHMKEGLHKEKLKLKKKILLLTTILFLEAEKEKKKTTEKSPGVPKSMNYGTDTI